MKLHLPHLLRSALLACFATSALFTSTSLVHADTIVLPTPLREWNSGGAPITNTVIEETYVVDKDNNITIKKEEVEKLIYSGSSHTYYEAFDLTLNISNGEYVAGDIYLANSLCNNDAILNIQVSKDDGYEGLHLTSSSKLTNNNSAELNIFYPSSFSPERNEVTLLGAYENSIISNNGKINISTDKTSYLFGADYVYGASITNFNNYGNIEVDIEAKKSATGISLSGEGFTNAEKATLIIRSGNNSKNSHGLLLNGSNVVNSGNIDITAHSTDFSSGIYVTNSTSISSFLHNENEGTINILSRVSDKSGESVAIYLMHVSGYGLTLTNDGSMQLQAGGGDVNTDSATAIKLESRSTLVNGTNAQMNIRAFDANDSLGIEMWDHGTVKNSGSMTIEVIGQNGGGISLSPSAVLEETPCLLENYGTIEVSVSASGGNPEGFAYGIDAPELINRSGGSLNVSTRGATAAIALFANKLINSSEMTLEASCYGSATGYAEGINGAYSIHNQENAILRTIIQSSGEKAVGITYSGIIVNDKNARLELQSSAFHTQGTAYGIYYFHEGVLNNAGILNIEATGGMNAYGICDWTGRLTNDGKMNISATATEEASRAYGISAHELHDSGRIAYVGDECVLVNNGTLEISTNARGESHGIYMEQRMTVYNSGTLSTDSIYMDKAYSLDVPRIHLLHGSSAASYTSKGELTIAADSSGIYYPSSSSPLDYYVDPVSVRGIIYLGGERGTDDSVTAKAGGSTVTIGSALAITGVTLKLVDEVTLKMSGDFSAVEDVAHEWDNHKLTIDNGESRHTVKLPDIELDFSGTVSFSQQDDGFIIDATGGSLILKSSFTATFSGTPTAVTVCDGAWLRRCGEYSYGELILHSGSGVLFEPEFTHAEGSGISGNLTLGDSVSFVLCENEEGAYSSADFFYVQGDIIGELSNVSLYTLTYDAFMGEEWDKALTELEGKTVVSVLDDGGKWLRLADANEEPPVDPNPPVDPDPLPPTITINGGEDGIVSEPLADNNYVDMGTGDKVDVSGLSELPQQFISGTGGELVTADSQTLLLSGTETLGYSLVGAQEGAAAADIVVGNAQGSIQDATIVLSGNRYESASAEVRSGVMQIEKSATLGTGTEDSMLTVGSGAGNDLTASVNNLGTVKSSVALLGDASMNNVGSIEGEVSMETGALMENSGKVAGHVMLEQGSELRNAGTLAGDVTLKKDALLLSKGGEVGGTLIIEAGAEAKGTGAFNEVLVHGSLYVGNSPGYWAVENITFHTGSDVTFCLDGTQAATPTHYGEGTGTYSQLHVENSLTLAGTPEVTLEIGAGLLRNGTGTWTLRLMTFGEAALATLDTAALEAMFESATLTGNTELLKENENGKLIDAAWDAASNALTLTTTVDNGAAAALLGNDGAAIANTLRSSTSALRSFARTATSQLGAQAAQEGETRVWGSALSEDVSMDGFSSNSYGCAVGADRQFGSGLRAGLAFGQMFGDFSAEHGLAEVEQESIMVGLYTQYLHEIDKKQSVSVTGYLAYGMTDNDADTRVGGAAELPGSASWEDETLAMGVRAEWNVRVSNEATVAPFIGLEYLRGTQDSFTESFAGGRREYSDGSMYALSLPIGITTRMEVLLGEQKLLPELTVAYVGDLARETPEVNSRVFGMNRSHKGTNSGRSAIMMNVGAQWLINDSWSIGAYYNYEARAREVQQEGSISVRYAF